MPGTPTTGHRTDSQNGYDYPGELSLICGLPTGGQIGTVDNGWNALSLSNFGQFGVGPNSQLDAGGEGWRDALGSGNINILDYVQFLLGELGYNSIRDHYLSVLIKEVEDDR